MQRGTGSKLTLGLMGLTLAAISLGVAGCSRETREGSATLMYRSLTLPPDVTVREFPEDQDGKRWQLSRSDKRINRSHLGVPSGCREKPTMFDPGIYVGYTCPDPGQPGSECLIDLYPTRGSQGADPTDSVDLVIDCGHKAASTTPATRSPAARVSR